MKNIHIHETFVDSQSANIYVRTAGNPEANEVLIILHGGPGLSHRYLRDLEQLATSDLLVVSYDQRASGLSSRSAQQEMHFSMQKPHWKLSHSVVTFPGLNNRKPFIVLYMTFFTRIGKSLFGKRSGSTTETSKEELSHSVILLVNPHTFSEEDQE